MTPNPPESDTPAQRPQRTLGDPKFLRAMAHPTRLALLEAFEQQEPLTATQAAELIGETPTNCAFHLRTLAKYGFLEEAGSGPGRMRPWQRTHVGFAFAHDDADPEMAHAAAALDELLWQRWLDRLARVNQRRDQLTSAERAMVHGVETVSYLAPDEVAAFVGELQDLLSRYRERVEDPTLRPVNGIAIESLLFTFPRDVLGGKKNR